MSLGLMGQIQGLFLLAPLALVPLGLGLARKISPSTFAGALGTWVLRLYPVAAGCVLGA